jgi:hypothetical protein
LAKVFDDEWPEEDGELNAVLGKFNVAALWEDIRWLSRTEKQRLLREISVYDEAKPHP